MLFWIFFILIALCGLFQLGLERVNWAWIRKNRGKVPDAFREVVAPEKAAKIEAYTQAKIILGLIGDVLGKALMLGLLLFDGFAWLSNQLSPLSWGPIPTGLLFFAILALAGQLLSLPFSWFATFRIEEKYGFNRSTFKLWVSDLVKGLILSAIMGGLLLWAILWLTYHGGALWWLVCWLVIFGFSLLMNVLYPMIIAPLFNKFTPLEEGSFKDRVLDLMQNAGIRSKGVFVMDAKKRSSHTNAFFTGMGRFKRIVFYDTLLEKLSEEEALAVLAHEAGHWRKKHILKGLVLSQAITLGLLALAGWLIQWEGMYLAFGFEGVTPYAGLFLLSIVASPALFFLQPLTSILSRKFEYEADGFASKKMGFSQALSSMLVKTSVDNLSNLNPHPLYVRFYYSHPTVVQRLKRIN